MHICFGFDETKLTKENYMENFDRLWNITAKNETEFSDCTDKYGHVESAY